MILKIVIVGVVTSIVNIVLKSVYKELIIPVQLVYLSAVLVLLVSASGEIFDTVSELFNGIDESEKIFKDFIKAASICLLTKFSADICLESGNRMICDIIDFSGRVMLTVIVLPYIKSVISIALAFAE